MSETRPRKDNILERADGDGVRNAPHRVIRERSKVRSGEEHSRSRIDQPRERIDDEVLCRTVRKHPLHAGTKRPVGKNLRI